MNDEQFPLTTSLDNLDKLPLETLIKLQRLYEDNKLPEKLSELIALHKSRQTQPQEDKNYAPYTFIHQEEKMANGMPIFTGYKAMFTLKGTDLIKALGWQKNKHLTKTEKLQKISQLAWVTNCLLIQAKWIYGRSKKDKDKYQIAIETSRVWDLSVREIGKENPLTKKVDNPEEVEITVRPGLWTYSFLNEGGRAAKTALYHFSWLSECIMSIDPYHEEAALRIAMIQSIAAYRNSFITVETWLKENLAGAGTSIEKAKKDFRRRAELKSYWDNIIITLRNVGFTVKFDPETYPEWLQPDSTEKNQRGYFDTLLQARVSITPPTPAYLEQQKTNPKPIKKTITGTDLKKARESAGLSLNAVADYFGKSRMWLSRKESGKRNLTQSEAKEILKALLILKDHKHNS